MEQSHGTYKIFRVYRDAALSRAKGGRTIVYVGKATGHGRSITSSADLEFGFRDEGMNGITASEVKPHVIPHGFGVDSGHTWNC